VICVQSICGQYQVRAEYVDGGYRIHYTITEPKGTHDRYGLSNPRDGAQHLEEAAASELRWWQPREERYKAPPLPRWAIYKSLLRTVYVSRRLMPMKDPRYKQLTDDIGWLQGLLEEHGGSDMCEAHVMLLQREIIDRFPLCPRDQRR